VKSSLRSLIAFFPLFYNCKFPRLDSILSPAIPKLISPQAGVSKLNSESYVPTDGQPASLSWNKAPNWGLRPDLYYCLTVAGLLIWGALSDERTGLSSTIAVGPRQRRHFRVRVP
jgi:hypothetical protein